MLLWGLYSDKSGGTVSDFGSVKGTSKNRFEKEKSTECVGCKESRRSKAVCLARRLDAADGVLWGFFLKQGF